MKHLTGQQWIFIFLTIFYQNFAIHSQCKSLNSISCNRFCDIGLSILLFALISIAVHVSNEKANHWVSCGNTTRTIEYCAIHTFIFIFLSPFSGHLIQMIESIKLFNGSWNTTHTRSNKQYESFISIFINKPTATTFIHFNVWPIMLQCCCWNSISLHSMGIRPCTNYTR